MFIKEKDESQMSYIAKHLIAGMFFTQDKEVQKEFSKAFEWIASSGSKEATQVMVDSFVKTGKQYKQYGADKMMLQLLQQVVSMQQKAKLDNEKELLDIVNKGISDLKQ